MDDEGFVWRPSDVVRRDANLTHFMAGLGVADFQTLTRRSNDEPAWFYDNLFRYLDYRFATPYDQVLDETTGPEFTRWCLGGTTNVVMNALDRWLEGPTADKPAIEWEGEDGDRRSWSYRELDRETHRLAGGLLSLGLGRGDVIAMYMPNVPQAAVVLLAVAKIGGVVLPMFSGFGADAIAMRLNHSKAKAVITVDGSSRRGAVVAAKPMVDKAAAETPSVEHVIVLRHGGIEVDWHAGRDHWWDEVVVDGIVDTMPVAADDPFLLVFTSGTTGAAKGVVHTHCGFPAKAGLDMGICMDFKPEDRIMWMSDMGWLVGPILVFGALVLGGTVILVEGAPNWPEPDRFWRLIDTHKVSWLGVAPTIIRTLMANGPKQLEAHDLSSIRLFASTGEAWDRVSWMWLFENVGESKRPILNYSGGTEMGGILTTTVIHPLKPCSFTAPVPGTGADVVDEQGRSVPTGEVGELVMRRPTLGLTRGLWNDEERYLDSYWRRIPGLWVQGDFASRDEDGLWYVRGRSDDTLKIAGKRTGPGEIEELLLETGEIIEAAVIGAADPVKGQAVICVCVPRPGRDTEEAKAILADAVVTGMGVPFRPKAVHLVADLPKTRNMKIMRRVVRAVHDGHDPGDLSSLVNPEAVDGLRQAFAN
jgi:acetyl-CoA synthetase